jgi:DNA-binding beta-propeller fold protein YncE
MTLGTPGEPGEDGGSLVKPTDTAVASNGDLFVSDGYGNARVHRFSSDGEHLLSWGQEGAGPGQFNTPHCVRLDKYDRVWVCDRNNRRIQIFDVDGNLLDQREARRRPDGIYIDEDEDVVYVSEIEKQVSIYTIDGELIAQWGGGVESHKPGQFVGGPHGIWVDSFGDLYVTEALTEGRIQKFVRL